MANNKSLYEKYLTKYNRAKTAESKTKTGRKSMAEEVFTKNEFDSMIGLYNNDIDRIVERQRYGINIEAYNARKEFLIDTFGKGFRGLRKMKYTTHKEFASDYSTELSDLYHEYRAEGKSGKEAKKLISQYVFGSP